jgi:hypothetical protein
MGSWVLYGLGTENQDLPGFVFMGGAPRGGVQNHASVFLPASYQATSLRKGERMDNLGNGNQAAQRHELDLIRAMDQKLLERQQVNPDLEAVIHSFELGFRMQSAVPRLLDTSGETKQTLALYGIGKGETDSFGRQCLVARRVAERGGGRNTTLNKDVSLDRQVLRKGVRPAVAAARWEGHSFERLTPQPAMGRSREGCRSGPRSHPGGRGTRPPRRR